LKEGEFVLATPNAKAACSRWRNACIGPPKAGCAPSQNSATENSRLDIDQKYCGIYIKPQDNLPEITESHQPLIVALNFYHLSQV
jgi:hypothetical protein